MTCVEHRTRPYEFRRRALRAWEAQDKDGASGALARACLVLLSRDWAEHPFRFFHETQTLPGFYCYPHDKMWHAILETCARHLDVDAAALDATDAPVEVADPVTLLSRVCNRNTERGIKKKKKTKKRTRRLRLLDREQEPPLPLPPRPPTRTSSIFQRLFKSMGDL